MWNSLYSTCCKNTGCLNSLELKLKYYAAVTRQNTTMTHEATAICMIFPNIWNEVGDGNNNNKNNVSQYDTDLKWNCS
jgi:hypothetical protein